MLPTRTDQFGVQIPQYVVRVEGATGENGVCLCKEHHGHSQVQPRRIRVNASTKLGIKNGHKMRMTPLNTRRMLQLTPGMKDVELHAVKGARTGDFPLVDHVQKKLTRNAFSEKARGVQILGMNGPPQSGDAQEGFC